MSPWCWMTGRLFARFPRVSGDEPVLMGVVRSFVVFSPRERG